MANHEAFQSLLLLTLLAVAVPLLLRWLGRGMRLPVVVGELLAGILAGRSGLHLIHETSTIRFLADFGLFFLMFLSGLELDFSAWREGPGPQGKRSFWAHPVRLSGLSFGLALLLAMGLGLLLAKAGLTRNPVLLGLILSTTSLGIVVPVLKERGLLGSSYGQCLLLAALLSDFIPMLLLGLYIALLTKGFRPDLLWFIVLLGLFAGAARLTRWANRHALTRTVLQELSYATAQIRVRGTFALIVLCVVLAWWLGVEPILGAFMAGAIIAQSRRGGPGELERQLDAIGYGFFIPLFFLLVGARFDLSALFGSRRTLSLAPALLVGAYTVNLLPALLFRLRFPWRESVAGGLLLASRLSLAVAAAAVAFDQGLITSGTNSGIILVALVTCTVSPLLFNRVLPPKPERRRQGIIVLGTDFLAELLGKRLRQDGEPVTFIGRDAERLRHLRAADFQVVNGAPGEEQTLHLAGAAQARALVALSNDPATVLHVCRLGRERFDIPAVVARAEWPEHVPTLQGLNVQVVQPAMAMAMALEGALHFPAALSVLTERSDQFDLLEAELGNPELFGTPLRQIHLPGGALVLGVRRRGYTEVVVPHGDTVVRAGDVLMLCGNPSALTEALGCIRGTS